MLEIFNFYLSTFSNRLNQFETYFPILIGFTWGLSTGAIITENEILLLIPMLLVVIISLFFMIYCIVIFIRVQNIQNLFHDKTIAESKFLDSVKILLVFTIVGGSYDALWIPFSLIFSEHFYLISTIGFSMIAVVTLIFLLKVNDMIRALPTIDITLIINELN